MSKMCVIYVKDREYGNRLLNTLTGRGTRRLAVSFINESTELKQLMEGENKVDCIITDEESYFEDIGNRCEESVVLLTEEHMSDKQVKGTYGDNVIGVNRYQPADNVYRQIVEGIGMRKKHRFASSDIIGIYTPVCVQERTAFALNVAKVLSEKYSVLYITLDVFSGLSEILPERDSGCLSDALYYYMQGKEAGVSKIKQTVNSYNGVDYIAPVRCVEDIECMSMDDIVGFVMCVAGCKEYEKVVLDIYSLRNEVYKLTDICSDIYMPVKEDYLAVKKLQEYENYNCSVGRAESISAAVKVKLPVGERGVCEDFWEHIERGGMYRYVKSLLYKGGECSHDGL
ncbi:MAG: hypothetical protein IJB96_08570 [Lachnospira sp.]|nr:hypothetical protein [Lachnospira sp.]